MPSPFIASLTLSMALICTILAGIVFTVRARRAAMRDHAHFVGVLDAVGFGVLLVHEDGTIRYANHFGMELLHRSTDEVVGESFHAVLHGGFDAHPGARPCDFAEAVLRRQVYQRVERFSTGRGQSLPVLVTVTPLPAESQYVMVGFRDGTGELAQGRQREEAFSLVSHEIRSPLTAVVGYSARLRAAVASGALVVSEARAEEITLLAREAQRMQEIILVVLETAEIEGDRVEVESEPLPLNRLVQEEIDRARRERPDATFVLSADDDVVVESDQRYVRRIVQNLLDNAVKYGDRAVATEVRLKQQSDGGCSVSVRDHGDGVPEEAQSRIFERFYRHRSAAGHGRGLGLGLYLSRRLASRLGGELTFTSVPGAGAEFVLVLPAICPEVEVQASER